MVDRDVKRPRRVRHMSVPRSLGAPLPPTPKNAAVPAPAGSESAAEDTGSLFAPNVAPVRADGSLVREPAPTSDLDPGTRPLVSPEPNAPETDGAKTPLGRMRVPERPHGFPTAALLADQDAEAAALRHHLDELRRRLDEAPPPLTPARRRNRRPLLGALVVGGTLGAIVTATLVPWSHLDLPGGNDRAGGTATSVDGTGTAARPQSPILAPRPAPAGSLPVAGPGITEPGTMMVVQGGRDDTLTVVEHAVLGPRGLRQIALALPSTASLGGEVGALTPGVSNLRVAVNGSPATVTANAGGWSVAVTGERARTVQLSYQIDRAVMRTSKSEHGRALGVVMPLLGQTLREQGFPLVVRTAGTQVSGATCPGAPSAETLCGTQGDGGWTAIVPASATNPAVLLQLTLS